MPIRTVLKKQFLVVQFVAVDVIFVIALLGWIAHYHSENQNVSFQFSGQYQQMQFLFFIISLAILAGVRFISGVLKKQLGSQNPGENPAEPIPLIGKLFTKSIVELGLVQVPAFLGFVLAVQSRQLSLYFPFALMTLLGLVMYFPKLSVWEEEIRSRTGAHAGL